MPVVAQPAARAARTSSRPLPAPTSQVLKRVPTLKKLDGQPVEVEEREASGK